MKKNSRILITGARGMVGKALIQYLKLKGYNNYISADDDETRKAAAKKHLRSVRNHIHNLIALITFSPKNKLPKLPKISPEDFNMKNHRKNLLTKNLNNIQFYLKKNDNKNIIIPLSEIYLNLKRTSMSISLENCLKVVVLQENKWILDEIEHHR